MEEERLEITHLTEQLAESTGGGHPSPGSNSGPAMNQLWDPLPALPQKADNGWPVRSMSGLMRPCRQSQLCCVSVTLNKPLHLLQNINGPYAASRNAAATFSARELQPRLSGGCPTSLREAPSGTNPHLGKPGGGCCQEHSLHPLPTALRSCCQQPRSMDPVAQQILGQGGVTWLGAHFMSFGSRPGQFPLQVSWPPWT